MVFSDIYGRWRFVDGIPFVPWLCTTIIEQHECTYRTYCSQKRSNLINIDMDGLDYN